MYNLFGSIVQLRGKAICGIYLLEINSKKYVGSSGNIKKRLEHHRSLFKRGKHDNKYLQNLYNKYGTCQWSILEVITYDITNLDLRKLEKGWIKKVESQLNLDDPVLGIGGVNEKIIYQYNLDGTFMKEWQSGMMASKELDIPYAGIYQCANPNSVPRSSSGYIWSYVKLNNSIYYNNTGSNLIKKEIHLYELDGLYNSSYKSLSDCARYLK